MEHIHASVMENSYFTDRRECFYGENALTEGKTWLIGEIRWDSDILGGAEMITEVDEWDGESEAIEVESERPSDRPGYHIVMGYRLMWSDGACDRMV